MRLLRRGSGFGNSTLHTTDWNCIPFENKDVIEYNSFNNIIEDNGYVNKDLFLDVLNIRREIGKELFDELFNITTIYYANTFKLKYVDELLQQTIPSQLEKISLHFTYSEWCCLFFNTNNELRGAAHARRDVVGLILMIERILMNNEEISFKEIFHFFHQYNNTLGRLDIPTFISSKDEMLKYVKTNGISKELMEEFPELKYQFLNDSVFSTSNLRINTQIKFREATKGFVESKYDKQGLTLNQILLIGCYYNANQESFGKDSLTIGDYLMGKRAVDSKKRQEMLKNVSNIIKNTNAIGKDRVFGYNDTFLLMEETAAILSKDLDDIVQELHHTPRYKVVTSEYISCIIGENALEVYNIVRTVQKDSIKRILEFTRNYSNARWFVFASNNYLSDDCINYCLENYQHMEKLFNMCKDFRSSINKLIELGDDYIGINPDLIDEFPELKSNVTALKVLTANPVGREKLIEMTEDLGSIEDLCCLTDPKDWYAIFGYEGGKYHYHVSRIAKEDGDSTFLVPGSRNAYGYGVYACERPLISYVGGEGFREITPFVPVYAIPECDKMHYYESNYDNQCSHTCGYSVEMLNLKSCSIHIDHMKEMFGCADDEINNVGQYQPNCSVVKIFTAVHYNWRVCEQNINDEIIDKSITSYLKVKKMYNIHELTGPELLNRIVTVKEECR